MLLADRLRPALHPSCPERITVSGSLIGGTKQTQEVGGSGCARVWSVRRVGARLRAIWDFTALLP